MIQIKADSAEIQTLLVAGLPVTGGGGGILANNSYLQGYDTGAVAHNLIGIDASNRVIVSNTAAVETRVPGGTSTVYIYTGGVDISSEEVGGYIQALSDNFWIFPGGSAPASPRLGLFAGSGNKSAGLKSPATLVSNYTLILPINVGSAGQVLSTDGNAPAQLSWVNASSGATFGPGAVTSITVVNGLVTAIS